MDEYLTKNPQTSLFTYDYRRITPFAKNTIMFPFNEKVDFGRRITASIPAQGDLVHTIHLYFRLPQLSPPPSGSTYLGWVNTVGYAMIEYVEFRLGETVIDRHSGQFMDVMDYISTSYNKVIGRDKSVGRYDTVNVLPMNALGEQDIYVPLQFWFNKKLPSALPLLSLSGQSVKIHVKLRPFGQVVTYDGNVEPVAFPIQDAGLIVDYYLLSDAEKVSYLTEPQDYLIEQWQYQTYEISAGVTTNRFTLDFVGCIKEIVFCLVEAESEDNNDIFNYGLRNDVTQGGEMITKIGLAMDGLSRQDKLPESFFRIVLPQRNHTFSGDRNIYVLSFAESPEINQVTGTANFSRYDRIELLLDFIDSVPRCKLHILGINYNKLNIVPKQGVEIEFLT